MLEKFESKNLINIINARNNIIDNLSHNKIPTIQEFELLFNINALFRLSPTSILKINPTDVIDSLKQISGNTRVDILMRSITAVYLADKFNNYNSKLFIHAAKGIQYNNISEINRDWQQKKGKL